MFPEFINNNSMKKIEIGEYSYRKYGRKYHSIILVLTLNIPRLFLL